jgi:hypothetical protein
MKSGIRGKAEASLHEGQGKFTEMSGKTTEQELEAQGKSEIRACSWNAPPEKKMIGVRHSEEGKIGWVLLWALGIPIPILVALYLLRGCT